MIVRWGLEELPGVLRELGVERPFLVASRRWDELDLPPVAARWARSLPTGSRFPMALTGSLRSAAGVRSHGQGGLVREWPAARVGPDHVLGIGVDHVLRHPGSEKRMVGGGGGANLAGIIYDPTSRSMPREVTARTALDALAHGGIALPPGAEPRSDRAAHEGAELINGSLPPSSKGPGRDRPATTLLKGAARAGEALGLSGLCLGHAMAQALGGRVRAPARRDERALPSTGAPLQRSGCDGGDRRFSGSR